MFKRKIHQNLLQWKTNPGRLPLIMRGARQVGKTTTLAEFGKSQFQNTVMINFESDINIHPVFDGNLEPTAILQQLTLLTGKQITPGKDLLILDEIQDCPRALTALRYFKEKQPDLHVIAAGSLLEFIFHEPGFSFPVGRTQFMHLYPLHFEEYLTAIGEKTLANWLSSVSLKDSIPPAIHNQLIRFNRDYMAVGGMPDAIQTIVSPQENTPNIIHNRLMQSYLLDIAKFANKPNYEHLQLLLRKIPQHIGSKVRYSKLIAEARSYQVKEALEKLEYAGLITKIQRATASGLPLGATIKPNDYKLLFLDIGLLQSQLGVDSLSNPHKPLLEIHRGALAEQYVGQTLRSALPCDTPANLFYWERESRNSSAEIDYLIQVENQLIPIEVKAGATGRLRSLKLFMDEKNCHQGVQISELPLNQKDNILQLPIYLTGQLLRLLKEI